MKAARILVALLVVTATATGPVAGSAGPERACTPDEKSALERIADYLGFLPSLGTGMKCASAGVMWIGCFTVGSVTVVAAFDPFPDEIVTVPASAAACGSASVQHLACTASLARDSAKNAAEEMANDLEERGSHCGDS